MKHKSLWCLSACLALGSVNASKETKQQQQPDQPAVPLVPQSKSAVNFDISMPMHMMIP